VISKNLYAKQDQIAIKERLGCVPGPRLGFSKTRFSKKKNYGVIFLGFYFLFHFPFKNKNKISGDSDFSKN